MDILITLVVMTVIVGVVAFAIAAGDESPPRQ
jgi:hypothetical protein